MKNKNLISKRNSYLKMMNSIGNLKNQNPAISMRKKIKDNIYLKIRIFGKMNYINIKESKMKKMKIVLIIQIWKLI